MLSLFCMLILIPSTLIVFIHYVCKLNQKKKYLKFDYTYISDNKMIS